MTADLASVYSADVVIKVRPPSLSTNEVPGGSEVKLLKPGARLISYVQPAQNPDLLESLVKQGTTAFAMDQVSPFPDSAPAVTFHPSPPSPVALQIPRISRAQVFDALSSMSSISGYRAVVEACNVYGRLLMGQITAAGRVQPSKVCFLRKALKEWGKVKLYKHHPLTA